MVLRVYNSFSSEKEVFVPVKEEVGLYACGPTVYASAHIGNLRAYVFADILRRYLEYRGYRVKHVMNITDLDDKTIAASRERGISLKEYTEEYTKLFFKDIELLNIKKADVYPRVTDHIPDMVDLIKILIKKGYAYRKDGSIYYRISQFADYGKLAGIDQKKVRPEVSRRAGIDADEYAKEDVRDFVLWKEKKEGEPFWETELCPGRPGWHIECSAMSMKYLGPQIDIHTGGVDNIFPHHQNEIAQSEAATGKKFVRYWMHCEHLLVNNQKMSKSLGNILTLENIIDLGYRPDALRYMFIASHYRSKLNFTYDALAQATVTVDRLNTFIEKLQSEVSGPTDRETQETNEIIDSTRNEFIEYMDDDLNAPSALASIFNMVKVLNITMNESALSKQDAKAALELMLDSDNVFAVMTIKKPETIPDRVKALIEKREQARRERDFKTADAIRQELLDMGIIIEDTKNGVKWRKR